MTSAPVTTGDRASGRPRWRIWASDAGWKYAARADLVAPGTGITVHGKTLDALSNAIDQAEADASQQIADAIAARIAAGRSPCKLPRELDLAGEFGVSYPTVRRAMAILRERSLIVTIHGRGTFIAS